MNTSGKDAAKAKTIRAAMIRSLERRDGELIAMLHKKGIAARVRIDNEGRFEVWPP